MHSQFYSLSAPICHLIFPFFRPSGEGNLQVPIMNSSPHVHRGPQLHLWQLAWTVLKWPLCPWHTGARDLLIGVWHQVFVCNILLLFQTLKPSLINYIFHATVNMFGTAKDKLRRIVIERCLLKFRGKNLNVKGDILETVKLSTAFVSGWTPPASQVLWICLILCLLFATLTLVKVAWVQGSCREQFPKWRQVNLPYLKGKNKQLINNYSWVFILLDCFMLSPNIIIQNEQIFRVIVNNQDKC